MPGAVQLHAVLAAKKHSAGMLGPDRGKKVTVVGAGYLLASLATLHHRYPISETLSAP
jgi:hypothetical protein